MESSYIDESVSMTITHSNSNGYFVMAILHVKEKVKLKRAFKRFISKNIEKLKEIDNDNKMFDGDKFVELKGSVLTPNLKKELARYLCKNKYFNVYYVTINNNALKNGKLYDSTARAFNYVLKCALTYYIHQSHLIHEEYNVQIDERNTKTFSINSLEDYLWLDLVMDKQLLQGINVRYFHSECNAYIQIADFFSNLYFSYLHNKDGYKKIVQDMKDFGYIVDDFVFPIQSK